MAASYPNSIKSFTTKTTGDTIEASHINDLQNEIIALESELGTNVAGTDKSTLRERLDEMVQYVTFSHSKPVSSTGILIGNFCFLKKVHIHSLQMYCLGAPTGTALQINLYKNSSPILPTPLSYPSSATAGYFRISTAMQGVSTAILDADDNLHIYVSDEGSGDAEYLNIIVGYIVD